ncbi:uncharacterized protein LOC128599043 isoform X4 [Ictalurus furcatus]|uniref:uncharacterized protein LOC128599043 isoform X4 n=1 Tax=Ictalurus furcatus TaxID=66913 RepID=UPI002350DBEE|nr:uncharacterized protein LOC128599043 isoform X4 [Ictalurus furcatus]
MDHTHNTERSTPAIMHLCAAVILPLLPCVVLSLDRQMVFGNLDESASLPCTVQCSGELTWTRFQKQDDVLVRCSSVSCWVKHRFILPYEQYLNGNSSLTMLKAAYSLRGLYMAKCVSETVCEVVFTLSPLEMTHVITPGEPIDVYLPLTDMVEVIFTASGAVQPSHPQICTVDKEKIQCSPEYKERASLLNTLQIKDGDVSDSGNYTVRDKVNDETLAIVTVHMRDVEMFLKKCSGLNQNSRVLELLPCPRLVFEDAAVSPLRRIRVQNLSRRDLCQRGGLH